MPPADGQVAVACLRRVLLDKPVLFHDEQRQEPDPAGATWNTDFIRGTGTASDNSRRQQDGREDYSNRTSRRIDARGRAGTVASTSALTSSSSAIRQQRSSTALAALAGRTRAAQ